jgi:hypothetical protein
MGVKTKVKMNNKKLRELVRSFEHTPKFRIGILADSTRSDGESNVNVGAVHELGLGKHRVRSFIMAPMYDDFFNDFTRRYLPSEVANTLFSGPQGTRRLVESFARSALQTILDAFDREGTSISPWYPSDMSRKKVHQTLTETGQLRDSISWELVDDK